MTWFVYCSTPLHHALVSECASKREATGLAKALRAAPYTFPAKFWFIDKLSDRAMVPWPTLYGALRGGVMPALPPVIQLPPKAAKPKRIRRRGARAKKPPVPAVAKKPIEYAGNVPRSPIETRPIRRPLTGLRWLKANDPSFKAELRKARDRRSRGSRVHDLRSSPLR